MVASWVGGVKKPSQRHAGPPREAGHHHQFPIIDRHPPSDASSPPPPPHLLSKKMASDFVPKKTWTPTSSLIDLTSKYDFTFRSVESYLKHRACSVHDIAITYSVRKLGVVS